MKDWQQISLKMYESDTFTRAEAASVISHKNVSYQGPRQRKPLQSAKPLQQECDKKEDSIKQRVTENLEAEFK